MREVKGEPRFSHPLRELTEPYLAKYSGDPTWLRNVRTMVDMELGELPEHKKATPGSVLFSIAKKEMLVFSSHPLDVIAHIVTSGEFRDIVGAESEGQVEKRHALYLAAITESAATERVLADNLAGMHGANVELSIKQTRDMVERYSKFKDSLFETIPPASPKEGNQSSDLELMPPEDLSRK